MVRLAQLEWEPSPEALIEDFTLGSYQRRDERKRSEKNFCFWPAENLFLTIVNFL